MLVEAHTERQLSRSLRLNGPAGGSVRVPPQFGDCGICSAPAIDERFQLRLLKPHLESAHRFQSADAATVAERELSDFPFLSHRVALLDGALRKVKHLLGGSLIDFAVGLENLHAPLFACKPCDNTGLNRGEVRHDEAIAGSRDKGRADKLREGPGNVVEEHFKGLKVSSLNELPCGIKVTVRHFILR